MRQRVGPMGEGYQADPFLEQIRARYAPEGFRIAAEVPYDPKIITASEARRRLVSKRERYRLIAKERVIPLMMRRIERAVMDEMDYTSCVVPYNLVMHEKLEDREMIVGYTLELLRGYGYYAEKDPKQYDRILISFRPVGLKQ